MVISDTLFCRTCKKVTKHQKRGYDICCNECHSIAVTEHPKVEKCCVVKCNKVANYQIGDNDKPNHESSFICEEHKNTVAHDWIVKYNGDAEDEKREDTLKFVRGLVNFKLREILEEIK